MRKKKKDEIIRLLQDKGYQKIVTGELTVDEEYKYLVKMPMDAVSEENVDKLINEHRRKQDELAEIKATSCQQMWLRELSTLEQEYTNYRMERDIAINGLKTKGKSSVVVKGKVVKKTGGNKVQLEEA